MKIGDLILTIGIPPLVQIKRELWQNLINFKVYGNYH